MGGDKTPVVSQTVLGKSSREIWKKKKQKWNILLWQIIKTYPSRIYPFLNICLPSHYSFLCKLLPSVNQSTDVNFVEVGMSQDIGNSHSKIYTISYMFHILAFHDLKWVMVSVHRYMCT